MPPFHDITELPSSPDRIPYDSAYDLHNPTYSGLTTCSDSVSVKVLNHMSCNRCLLSGVAAVAIWGQELPSMTRMRAKTCWDQVHA